MCSTQTEQMKSTKPLARNTYQANNNARLLATARSVAILPSQLSLLCGLAASVCLVGARVDLLLVLPEQSSRTICFVAPSTEIKRRHTDRHTDQVP